MNLNRTPNPLDRDARNKENENWDRLENKTRAIDDKLSDIVNVVSDEAMEKIIDKITINWKGPVDSFEDLPEDAEVGDAHYVYDDKQVYRYDGENWIDITMIDLSPVEEVDSRLTAEIETLDAKVDNNEEEFNQHVESKNNPHEVTKSQVGLSNVDNVKQASKTEFNQHKDNKTNPHNVTKSQVGLGNVDNVKQATKSEFDQFKGDTETQLTNKVSQSKFDEHSFGDIRYTSSEDKIYYLDEFNGDDENDGLTEQTAFKSWCKIKKLIPRFLYHKFEVIIIGDYSDDIYVKNVISSGELILRGKTDIPSNHVLRGEVTFFGFVGHSNLNKLQNVRTTNLLGLYGVNGISIINCEPRRPDSTGVYIATSSVSIRNCDFGNEIVKDCIQAHHQSLVTSNANTGVGKHYGLSSHATSVIGKSGSQPTGKNANEFADSGGEIR